MLHFNNEIIMTNRIKSILSAFALLWVTSGCTSDFNEINTDPMNPTTVDAKLLFAPMLKDYYGEGKYQINFNLFANQYAQYISCTKVGWVTDRYGSNSNWISSLWQSYYLTTVNCEHEMERQWADDPTKQDMLNIGRIMKVFNAHIITDQFGDIPYFEAGKGNDQLAYDTQESIYKSFFKELTDAQAALPGAGEQESLGIYDYMYGGDPVKWKKFANTLRLRLALRIAEVDPVTAQKEGEAAIRDGIFTSAEDDGDVPGDKEQDDFGGFQFYLISYWSEFRMSSTLESIYKKVSDIEDPRMVRCWYPTENDETIYRGIDNGMSDAFLGSISTKDYSNVSSNTPSSDKFYNGTTEYMIFSYAESRFLLAEAAWRGWASAGSAKEHYEEGIKASMDYLKITPEQYSGYMNGGDVPFSTDKEKQLEQIITQKYIAIFPNGHEAWAEFRRTGYPKYLKPVAHPEAGSVPEGQFIKKIQYVNDEYDYNPSHVNDPNLNGGQGDGVNVRVWWDTGKYK